MTNEERTIRVLINVQAQFQSSLDEVDVDKDCKEAEADNMEVVSALGEAIKALSTEPCEDCISRDELLKAVDTWDKFGCDANTKLVPYKDHYIPYIHYDDVIKAIKGMPSVHPKPKTGHWEFVQRGKFIDICCSECGYVRVEDFAYGYTINKLDKESIKEFFNKHPLNFCECCETKMLPPDSEKE